MARAHRLDPDRIVVKREAEAICRARKKPLGAV
jgi:hypothetical protein